MNWLVRHRAPALILIDLIAIQVAVYLTYTFRFESGLFREPLHPEYLSLSVALTLFWILLFLFRGLYLQRTSISRYEAVVDVFRATVIGVIILFIISMDPRQPMTSTRVVLVTHGVLILFLVGTGRALLRTFIRSLYRRRVGLFRCVVIGCGPRGQRLHHQVRTKPEYGYQVKALVHVGEDVGELDHGAECVPMSKLSGLIDSKRNGNGLEYALVAVEPEDRDSILQIIEAAHRRGLKVMIEPDFMQVLVGQVKTRELYGVPLLEVFPELMTPTGRVLKRLIDIVVSFTVLAIALPFMLVIALLIRLTSPGKALYVQKRVGYRGREFTIAKFRTMFQDAEKETGAVWATKGDPRITPIGRFLRSTRIDEIPQLWNVLVGDMSLVGPRPERRVFVDEFSEKIAFYSRRLNVKPGITGWAQIRRGYDETLDDVREKLQYDLFYLENISISLDIKILLNTLWVMVSAKGH